MKSTKAALILPGEVKIGSVVTLTYEEPELGPTPYHGIVLSVEEIKGNHLLTALIIYWEDAPELVAIDLKRGRHESSIRHSQKGADKTKWKISRLEICDPNDIRHMIGEDVGGPPLSWVPGGGIETNRRRH
jgi:hypothetical protein